RGVLTVAALGPDLKRASFSNFGSLVDFSAPGVDILSLRAMGTDMYNDGAHFVPPGDTGAKYYRSDGTSMACPFASGVSALLLGQYPSLSETTVRRALAASASETQTTDSYIGAGILDAEDALGAVEYVSDVNAGIFQPEDDSEPIATDQNLPIFGTADGDSYTLEVGEGYYPSVWSTISQGGSVTDGLLGQVDLSDKQGPYHVRLSVNDGTRTAIEHTVFWAEPDLHPGWPVRLGGNVFRLGGFILGASFNATPADADGDGSDEIFLCSIGHTFGLRGDGTILPGWPTVQLEYPAFASNASFPGPAVADVDNDGNTEILWTLRDYWPDYYGSPSTVWSFNAKSFDGSCLSGFPKQAIETPSNAHELPFVLADLDGNGTLEAVAAHTKGNTADYYRISAFDHSGVKLFTRDFADSTESVRLLSFGDIDADGQKEIVAVSKLGYASIRLHVLDGSGIEEAGYPVTLRNLYNEDISAPPFLVDLDRDGDLEVVIGTTGYQSYIHCYHHNGSSYPGFPIAIGNYDTQIFGYCLGDINGDGQPEIIVLANHRPVAGLYRVYVKSLNGTTLPGWPLDLQQWPNGTPAIVDVDNDGRQDVCFTAFDGSVYACSGDGELVPGFPKKMSFASTSGVSIGDIDGDGLFELIAATMVGTVYVWDLPTLAYRENSDWPMRSVNPRNTNVFEDRLLGRSDCDLTGDHTVDWADFSLFALSWLHTGDRLDTDFSRNGIVQFDDFTRCAKYWLEGKTP
ncbi:MAG: VCBS repeat-containing protein, partial [Sedimentisphaerales bacterium]|nr:VCBS repeat-containing protein [Sedimentisphaerales bacterium]